MDNNNLANNHTVYFEILQSRGIDGLQKNMPLWKFKLTEIEYESLKQTLRSHPYNLSKYGSEAALCYAEWWRRDYRGGVPSKEDVAIGIGLDPKCAQDLYKAARLELKNRRYTFIHSLKGTEYFRTLLNQGGLPVNYIKSIEGNIGNFSRFLKGLVRELSAINYDWSTEDYSIIQQFSCISYLGKAFKNDNIYDVAMQIAHAIIMDDNALLPYDDTDDSLAELTKSLKREYIHAKTERKVRPLSLHWKLHTTKDGRGHLFVNMDIIKDISSDSIPGINISTCYAFDVFVAGKLVGKYVRKSMNRNDLGEITTATYTRISLGLNKDILWNGEPVVEIKIRCDNDDRIFLTVAGCYPPNFEYPQVFQLLDDDIYCKSETANAENNIAVFTSEWKGEDSCQIIINEQKLSYDVFTRSLNLENEITGETLCLTNEFTPYVAEFAANYIPWVEKSNYKLLTKIPIIRVYDKEKSRVYNCKTRYRIRNNNVWKALNSSCVFPIGLVDICVEFPDGHFVIETFYSVDNLNFTSCNATAFSTEIVYSCNSKIYAEIEMLENVDIKSLDRCKWRITRSKDCSRCPSTCEFRLFNANNPILRLSVSIPFDGVMITDVDGNIVPNGKIISFVNLAHYRIICHGGKNKTVDVSYVSERIEDTTKLKHFQSPVIQGLVSLSDYSELIERMFNMYGANSFDRSSSVVLNISGKEIFVRKFILESTIEGGNILIIDSTQEDTEGFIYEGDIYAFPVGNNIATDDFFAVKLNRVNEIDNLFTFPEEFIHRNLIIFSGPEVRRRIVPKYYDRDENDFDKEDRSVHSSKITNDWYQILNNENVITGKHWRDLCRAFEICSRNNLPFATYNGLKSVTRNAELIANFVIAMWLNESKNVLIQDIERFEHEMGVALHWISAKVWEKCISDFMDAVPDQLKAMMMIRMQKFVALLQELFNSILSTDIVSDFTSYLISGKIEPCKPIISSEINNYKMKIHGLSDTNHDLPRAKFELSGQYYPHQRMLDTYRAMIESAMCAAENTCGLDNCVDLFSFESKEQARIANFYRKYFKETYCEIFFRTIKLISNKTD